VLKARQKLGKYRIERRLADGGFATVYQALDTIEGIRVALKIPHASVVNESLLNDFRKEARLTARLDHAHILPLKNASFIDGQFVIVSPLGEKTLADRLRSRMSLRTALDLAEQMIDAVAYAHRQRIIHCDIKPENFIIFPGGRVRLTDFGIAKVAQRTIRASGSGTVGYMAPEQAMGKPSLRSDVFSLGLVLYRMLTGTLPEWPYRRPPAGYRRLRGRVHPELIEFLRKAMEMNPRKRFRDADQMLTAFRRVKPRALLYAAARRRRQKSR
jgi:eukaryotic-like serine/threonine-protein kinase